MKPLEIVPQCPNCGSKAVHRNYIKESEYFKTKEHLFCKCKACNKEWKIENIA